MGMDHCMSRKEWDLPFLAQPGEVAALRRIIRIHLTHWGLPDLVDTAQLCLSELVSNVITHVGAGTPTTLAVSVRDTNLRIEVRDPDARALPTLVSASIEAEAGRGMAMVNALTDRWGVILTDSGKATWCEIPTGLTSANGHAVGPRVVKAEALLTFYSAGEGSQVRRASPLSLAVAEEAAVDLISDLLHWFRAHGRDVDDALDRAQMHFEAELEEAG
jgi:anti-sigma regulatory factor (Ser/Thr protein kinase)